RRVFGLYAEIRATADSEQGWQRWRSVRTELFRDHPQSPHPGYAQLDYFPYDPSLRLVAEVVPAEPERRVIGSSGDEPVWFTRFATARFDGRELELYWLPPHRGGRLLPLPPPHPGRPDHPPGP